MGSGPLIPKGISFEGRLIIRRHLKKNREDALIDRAGCAFNALADLKKIKEGNRIHNVDTKTIKIRGKANFDQCGSNYKNFQEIEKKLNIRVFVFASDPRDKGLSRVYIPKKINRIHPHYRLY